MADRMRDYERNRGRERRRGYYDPGYESDYDYHTGLAGRPYAFGYTRFGEPPERGFYGWRGYTERDYGRDYGFGPRGRQREGGRAYGPTTRGFDRSFERDWDREIERDYDRDYRSGFAGRRPQAGMEYQPTTGTAGYGAWSAPGGPHAGRGPRNYERLDEHILEDVGDRLTQHGQLDASHIYLNVQNGIVTLSGSVDSRWARREAEDVAYSVTGVKDVMNELRVSPQDWSGSYMGRSYVRDGMEVHSQDGQRLGTVRAVGDNDFMLSRQQGADLYVPFEVVQSVVEHRIIVGVRANEVENQGWPEAGPGEEAPSGGKRQRRDKTLGTAIKTDTRDTEIAQKMRK